MKSIDNLKEKSLIIARLLIDKQINPTDENINTVWCDMYPYDNPQSDTELMDWIRKFVNSRSIAYCDKQLAKIRRNGEISLKGKGQCVGYSVKLVKQPKNALATYDIFTKGKKYSGNYSSLSRRLSDFSKQKVSSGSKQ